MHKLMFAALLLLTPALHAQALEGEEIAANKEYAAGTRLKSALSAISFKVPEGLKARTMPDFGAIVFESKDSSRGGILVTRSGLSEADVKGLFPDQIDLSFMVFDAEPIERRDGPNTSGDRTTSRYGNDQMKARTVAIHGAGKGGYALLLYDTNDDKAKDAVETFEKEAVLAAPAEDKVRQWRRQVESKVLSASGNGQSVECKFGKDGKYTLALSDGTNSVTQAGKWRVVLTPFGGLLILDAEDGTQNAYTMLLKGDSLTLNGVAYSRKAFEDGGSAEAGKLPRPKEADDKGKYRKVVKDPNWKSDLTEVEKLEGDEIQIGVPLQGEKRLKTDFLGVSFKLPANMFGGVDARAPFFIMRPADQRGLGLVYAQTGMNSAPEIAAFMHQDFDLSSIEKGVVLKPEGESKIEGGKVTQDYTHDVYTARAVALVGPSGNGVLVCFIGAKADKERMEGYVKAVADSVQLKKPQAEEKRAETVKQLHGKKLHIFRYKSSSAGSGNSSSWETNIWFHFGSDGTYFYKYKFTGDHYVKGTDSVGDTKYLAGAVNENDREESGKWRIEFNITGALVYCTSDKGYEHEHQLRVAANKVFVDEEEVSVGQSEIKK